MKLKKILKYLDDMENIDIRIISSKGTEKTLYSGRFWDIPKSLKKRELDYEGKEPAIFIANEINNYGVRIDKFLIYVKEEPNDYGRHTGNCE